jgi:hypothetical protein
MIVSIFLSLVICEIIIRSIIFLKNKKDFASVIKNLPEPKHKDKAWLGNIIQPCMNSKIIYELRPNISVNYDRLGLPVKTNNQGWRSNKDYSVQKDTDTIRIVGLGDSFMFGSNVDQNKNIMDVLERKLNENFPRKKWEVINTAVPGYNTVMEIETLKEKALVYKPDIVIIEYVGNDMHLPNFIYATTDRSNIKKLYFLEFLRKRCNILLKNFNLFESPLRSDLSAYEYDPSKVPEEFRAVVGWDSYVKAMLKLKKMKEKYKFDVISFLTLGWKDDRVFELSKMLGFDTLYNDAYNPRDISLVISKNDKHPSELGHKKNADFLLEFMIKENIINKHMLK